MKGINSQLLILIVTTAALTLLTCSPSSLFVAARKKTRRRLVKLPHCCCACAKRWTRHRYCCRAGNRGIQCCGGGRAGLRMDDPSPYGESEDGEHIDVQEEDIAPPPPPPPPPSGFFGVVGVGLFTNNDEFEYYPGLDVDTSYTIPYEEYYAELERALSGDGYDGFFGSGGDGGGFGVMGGGETLQEEVIGESGDEKLACLSPLELVQQHKLLRTFQKVIEAAPPNARRAFSNKQANGTVLAPSDAAFEALEREEPGALKDILAAPVAVLSLLRQHIIEDQSFHLPPDAPRNSLTAANGRPLRMSAASRGAVSFTAPDAGSSATALPDAEHRNLPGCASLLHVLDTVLIPGEGVEELEIAADARIVGGDQPEPVEAKLGQNEQDERVRKPRRERPADGPRVRLTEERTRRERGTDGGPHDEL